MRKATPEGRQWYMKEAAVAESATPVDCWTKKCKRMEKVSIRFYNDHEVRAVWSEEDNIWFFSVLDVLAAINNQDDYRKTRNYWK